jgi:hypothetical protein
MEITDVWDIMPYSFVDRLLRNVGNNKDLEGSGELNRRTVPEGSWMDREKSSETTERIRGVLASIRREYLSEIEVWNATSKSNCS